MESITIEVLVKKRRGAKKAFQSNIVKVYLYLEVDDICRLGDSGS